jgi:molecular chaperone HtpG
LAKGYDVLVMDGVLDSHFIGALERNLEKVTLKRVDAELVDKLIDKDEKLESVLTADEETKVLDIFKKAIGDEKHQVSVAAMSADELPVAITVPEFMRRMQEMAKMQQMGGMGDFPMMLTISVNGNHSVVQRILKSEQEDEQLKLAKQAYDLALLSQGMLSGASLTAFIKRSAGLIGV